MSFERFSPEALLGPLNEVERKFAPADLFVAGHPEILRDGARVAIVGSREASGAGVARARKLARLLEAKDVVVVSGLARGIDTAAHRGAMEAGGRTVAVIGTPLDRCYPRENEALQAEIMRDHLCVSQFPSGRPTQPRNFPIRNRTMALIADVTVIVEAGESSGSLSQGWEALRLGRGLYIPRWLAQNSGLRWPSEMLAYGARVLADETFDEFCEELPERKGDLVGDALAF